LYEAFEARRLQLVEARSRRADSLVSAANRILEGIASRALRLPDADALRGYLASDAMVDKVRQIADQLQQLGDTVRMDDVLGRLKVVGDDSLRQLRDRQELFTGEEGLIRLGKHQFSVNRQPVELTTVVRQGQIQLHLTGTQFFQPMSDPALNEAADLWEQHLPSESAALYRGEYLAAVFCEQLRAGKSDISLKQFMAGTNEERENWLRAFMQPRHDEGYSRGVHDRDAALIAHELLKMESGLGLLRFDPTIRGLTNFAWQRIVPTLETKRLEAWIASYHSITQVLPKTQPSDAYVLQLRELLDSHAADLFAQATRRSGINNSADQDACLATAAKFLFEQLIWRSQRQPLSTSAAATAESVSTARALMVSPRARHLLRQLEEHLPKADRSKLSAALQLVATEPIAAWTLAWDAVQGFFHTLPTDSHSTTDPIEAYQAELSAILLAEKAEQVVGPDVAVALMIEGLSGDHARLSKGKLLLHYHQFERRVQSYTQQTAPRFRALRETKMRLLHQAEQQLRSSEFKAQVLTSFVRNKLIDEVYLPLIGDNLAKQIGAAGDKKRSDRMGLLLLISPPGYGKTTLMEYMANRLGLVFVKVNGPALGHKITSLDPAEASNASAREEVKRINLALEMGDNVMLYLDDIQHCNAELLQKFISLCDATRRIEGVWEGQPKTYDLRGRKVAVVMAGNPYTESGERFQIPDMLANRADVYNLGEIIGDAKESFEMSYIENCLTSNTTLQPLARSSNKDQRAVIQAAERGTTEGLNLESNLPADQLTEMINVLGKLFQVRNVVLQVNRAYIRSAAQVDAYRTEPPFKLQGSYRNMNRIAERVVPVMNNQELQSLVMANYEQDAQTLTRDGEANLLKFKEILGTQTKAEAERWENIKYAYVESVRMQGIEGEDNTAQVLRILSGLRDGLESIRRTMSQAIASQQPDQQMQVIEQGVTKLTSGLSHFSDNVTQAIKAGAEQLHTASQQLPDQKVLVQHSVPRVMTDLVQSQFQLLYDGLRPVLESSTNNRQQLEALRKSIDDCLNQYRDLKTEIDKAG
jgi:AAA domain (dynein-related subfamily)